MEVQTVLRDQGLEALAELLQTQHARKVDVVASATSIAARGGMLGIRGTEVHIDEEGVTPTWGTYQLTNVATEGLAAKLNVPTQFLKKMHDERPDIFDRIINGLLHGRRQQRIGSPIGGPLSEIQYPADPRSFLIRCFRGDDGVGVARAVLSDRYQVIDNLDVLTAVMSGVQQAGLQVKIEGCDLSERRMMVRISAPEVRAYAKTLLRGYRSPWSGATGDANPVVFAGFVFTNSETGGGAFSITPRVIVEVCSNGMQMTKDALRAVHLGGRLEDGLVKWSDLTQQKAIELVTARTKDAVTTFLDVEYVERCIADIEQRSERCVETVDQVTTLVKKLSFTQEQTDGVLAHFIKGGLMTRGGVVQAITAHASEIKDPDVAHDMEASALRVLEV